MQPDQLNIVIEELKELLAQTNECASSALKQVGLQIRLSVVLGDKLNEVRKQVGDGSWHDWLAGNMEGIEPDVALRFMKLADFAAKGNLLDSAASIRRAFRLAGIIP